MRGSVAAPASERLIIRAGTTGQRQRAVVVVALLIILGLGLPLRLIDITALYSGYASLGQAHYSLIAHNFAYSGPFLQYDDLGRDSTTTPLVPWLVAGSWAIFGPSEWAARLPMLLCGLATLWLFFLLARTLYGPAAALIALALAAAMPDLVYFSRSVQLDGPLVTAVMGANVALLRYRRTGQERWWGVFLVALTLAVLCKWTAVLFLPLFGALWAWQPVGELSPRRFGWARAACAVVLPPLPAIAWTLWSIHQVADSAHTNAQLQTYFERGSELTGPALSDALQAVVLRIMADLSIFTIVLLLGLPWLIATWRRHVPMLLLVATCLPPLAYPHSYIDNIYYIYPALYGLALLCAAVGVTAVRALRPQSRSRAAAIGLAAFLVLADGIAIESYLYFVHQNVRVYGDEIAVARDLGRRLHPGEQALIVSQWFAGQLMYYVGGDSRNVQLLEDPLGISADQSALLTRHVYHYVLFDMPPPTGTQRRLHAAGYRPLYGAMLWQLT